MTDFVGRGHLVHGAGFGERVLAWQQRLRGMWLRTPWSKGWRLRRVSATVAQPTSRLWLVAPGILAALIGIPLVVVATHLGALSSPEVRHLAQTVLLRYVANTVGLVTVVGGLTALIGVSTAWLTTAFEFPGRRALSWLLVLPLALPTYIAAISYAGMFDYTGPAQLLFRRVLAMAPGSYPTLDMQTFVGLSFVLTVTVYPYAYLTSRAVFARQSAAVMEIARCHGYGAAQALRPCRAAACPARHRGRRRPGRHGNTRRIWRVALLRRRYPDHRHLPRLVRPGQRGGRRQPRGRTASGGRGNPGAGALAAGTAPATTRRACCSARCRASGCADAPPR